VKPGEEIIDMTTCLARLREDLVLAIAADQLRSRRRRRVRLAGLAIAAMVAVGGTSVAATTGLFSAAPDDVKSVFDGLEGSGVDASKAIRIGVIDEHAAYAAPTADGGFCLYFAPNPGAVQRSGPSGSSCLPGGTKSDEIAINVSLGHDGGFVFGRVGAENAATVEISVPNGGGVLTGPVAEERFFLVDLPPNAMRALMVDGVISDTARIEAITVTAMDAQGSVVARAAVGEWAPPDVPTETGPVPNG
jgi:hypothetical protein